MGRRGLAGRPQTQLGFFSTVSHRDEASDSNGVAYIKGKAGKEVGEGKGDWGREFDGRNSREVALTSWTSSEVIREVISEERWRSPPVRASTQTGRCASCLLFDAKVRRHWQAPSWAPSPAARRP